MAFSVLRRVRIPLLLLTVSAAAAHACGSKSTPTTPTVTPTRVIELSGSLGLGNVLVGASTTGTLKITNSGNATMNITGVTGPTGITSSFTGGQITAGASQSVTLTFAPASAGSMSGFITVTGDQTAGSNTISISASVFPNMNGTWSGTQKIVAGANTSTCNMTWLVSGQTAQTAVTFNGAWQLTGAGCGQVGALTGTVALTNAVTGVGFTVNVGSTCATDPGAGPYNGTIAGSAVALTSSDTVTCPGLGTTARAVTLSMSKQ